MAKIMLGDYLINPDNINSVAEKELTFKVEVPQQKQGFFKSLLSTPEYRPEKLTIVRVGISGNPDFLIIYSNSSLLDYVGHYLEALDNFSPYESYGDFQKEMVETIEALGPNMVFGRRWVNLSYIRDNLVYEPDVRSREDFIRKYL